MKRNGTRDCRSIQTDPLALNGASKRGVRSSSSSSAACVYITATHCWDNPPTLPLVGSARVSYSCSAASLYLCPCIVTPPPPLLLLAPLLLLLLLPALMLTGSEGLAGSRLALNSHQGSHRPPEPTCMWHNSDSRSSFDYVFCTTPSVVPSAICDSESAICHLSPDDRVCDSKSTILPCVTHSQL
jgi:hypothetical protein